MPKTGDFIRRLRRAGFRFVEHGKRHDLYMNDQNGKRVRVWRHNRDIPTGTYYSMLEEAGLVINED